jgi:serine palmitoyltransferase
LVRLTLSPQVELKEKYKFRIILDETWSFGVLGRTGRGITEAQNVDPHQIDMIIGSLAGPLCAGGGFCAGSKDVVEHQRITAASYTFSAAMPAMIGVAACETLSMIGSNPDIINQCRENIKAMRAQLDPRSDWVVCTSDIDNPVVLLVLKPEIVEARSLSVADQERLLADCVDEVGGVHSQTRRQVPGADADADRDTSQTLTNNILITRLKINPILTTLTSKDQACDAIRPALKICVTSGLSKKEIEKAGVAIRHAITKVMTRKPAHKAS